MYGLNNFSLDFKTQNIYVFFDGNNIAISRRDKKIIALSERLKNIQKLSQTLIFEYINVVPIIFIDPGLQRIIDDTAWLNQQLANWNIFQCERGYKADDYLIGFLKTMPFQVIIVSNDKFREYNIPRILESRDWRFKLITKGTSVYIPGLEKCIENMLNVLYLAEQINNSKSFAEGIYSL